jgi:regulator of replication initiation timing
MNEKSELHAKIMVLENRISNLEKENDSLKCDVIELSLNDPTVFRLNLDLKNLRKSLTEVVAENLDLYSKVQELDRQRFLAEKELKETLEQVEMLFGNYSFKNGILIKE